MQMLQQQQLLQQQLQSVQQQQQMPPPQVQGQPAQFQAQPQQLQPWLPTPMRPQTARAPSKAVPSTASWRRGAPTFLSMGALWDWCLSLGFGCTHRVYKCVCVCLHPKVVVPCALSAASHQQGSHGRSWWSRQGNRFGVGKLRSASRQVCKRRWPVSAGDPWPHANRSPPPARRRPEAARDPPPREVLACCGILGTSLEINIGEFSGVSIWRFLAKP